MTDHAAHKRLLVRFLTTLAEADEAAIPAVLRAFCTEDCIWRIFHPFDVQHGVEAAASAFWAPFKRAFPDYEQRPHLVVGGDYEGEAWVSSWGFAMGSFAQPWLGIPPTHGLTMHRFGVNAMLRDGKFVKIYVLLDVLDVMRQAGFYPLRKMPGTAEQWAAPPVSSGADAEGYDGALGARTLAIVREMQIGLPKPEEIANLSKERGKHSPHWHTNMNWYGSAGIGSSRGKKGFIDFHGALFVQAFPDRAGVKREETGPEDRPGHYIRVGDGRFAVTSGYPGMFATHLGGEWLGLPPSGRRVEMRIADWYRLDADEKIIDNWVMIDVLHILAQFGLDVLDDLRYIADPSLDRWPKT